jgi:cell division protein FtsB
LAVSDGHKTTAIRRPVDATRSIASDQERTRFSDFTRPISADKRLVRGPNRWVVTLAGVVIGGLLAALLFVFPFRSYLNQQDDLAERQRQLDVVLDANAQLAAEINRLRTPEGIREAARTEIGYVDPGEIRISLQQQPDAPLTLPAGFPYDAVAQVMATRAVVVGDQPAEPVAPSATSTTTGG